MQVQKNCEEDLLPHDNYLMEQFDLKGGGHCTANNPETMNGFVAGDEGSESEL